MAQKDSPSSGDSNDMFSVAVRCFPDELQPEMCFEAEQLLTEGTYSHVSGVRMCTQS